ncbi:transporter [Ganoderma sinense ZZ0214-1]|uniref:Transporter n=1 Tax=Ganoderma sinense ZZ0214-1 TaxID=1077348 RepID=A0A2G8SBR5_9APHY|nr:transporter [Ganoderma sinense ZZ0214-1]
MAAADSLPDFTGCFLDDRYELIKMLGSGSFGVVYKAIDHEIADDYDRIVAVKILRKAGRSAAHLACIRREVAFHSAVAYNEGVVTLYDTFDDEKWCHLVLEFCGGGDLFDQIIARQVYAGKDELIRTAFLSLLDAVQGCHDAGIAHRDLKPENVLTNEDGSQCYLADFGLASDEPLVHEFSVGTGLYMSPECVGDMTDRASYDPFLSDIWALGVILLNMITGENLWERATPKDTHFARFLMDPDFLYHTYPMSAHAQSILLSLLELDPALRVSLSTVRDEVLAIETFFRPASPFEHAPIEHEDTTLTSELERELEHELELELELGLAAETSSESGFGYDYESEYDYEFEDKYKSKSYMASEIDIPCATASPEPDVRGGRDCSAGSAVDLYAPPTTTTTTTPSYSSSISFITTSYSSARASYGTPDAEEAVTPEGTTIVAPTTAYMLWERMMAGDHLNKSQSQSQYQSMSVQEAHGYEGWQKGATAQMLMAQYQQQYCSRYEYYDLF